MWVWVSEDRIINTDQVIEIRRTPAGRATLITTGVSGNEDYFSPIEVLLDEGEANRFLERMFPIHSNR